MDWAIKTVMKNVPTTVQLILTDFTFNIYNLLKFSINCYKSSIFHMPTNWKHFIKRKHTHINTKLNRYKRARKSQSLISWKQNIIHEWFPYLLQFYSACWHPFFHVHAWFHFFLHFVFHPFSLSLSRSLESLEIFHRKCQIKVRIFCGIIIGPLLLFAWIMGGRCQWNSNQIYSILFISFGLGWFWWKKFCCCCCCCRPTPTL